MAGPGDERAAAAQDPGRLRASHADRERVIEVLKFAFVQGRLTKDELDLRVSATFASRTYAELRAVTADLPAVLIASQMQRSAATPRASRTVNPVARASILAILAVVMLVVGLFTGTFLLVVACLILTPLVAGAQALDSRQQRRSGGQLPPERRGRALGGQKKTTIRDDLIFCEARGRSNARELSARRTTGRAWRSLPLASH